MGMLSTSYMFYLIPKKIVPYIYSILRNINYFQIILFNVIILSRTFPYFRIKLKIEDKYKLNNKCSIRIDKPEALRRINKELMNKCFQPKTKSEKLQQIIYSGSRNMRDTTL